MKWRRRKPPRPRVDRLLIAELECELLGIEPAPGTAAALAVGLRRAFGSHGSAGAAEARGERETLHRMLADHATG